MILLTGGLGFIGSHTAAALRDLGADVLLGQRRAGPLAVRVDCTDLDSLRAVGARHQVTGIVHLAAAGLDAGPVLDKLWADTLSLFNVLRVAQEWDVQRVVLASTIGVYAGVPDGVFREDLPLPLASPHAIPAAKKVTEVVAGALDGLPLVCARIGAIWGPLGRTPSPFFGAPQLMHAAVRSGPAPVGLCADDAVDMLYAKDAGRALALLATGAGLRHRTYNVGSGILTTNREVAAAIARVVPGAAAELASGDRPVHAAALDVGRLRADTGFRPRFTLDAAVGDYAAWLRGHER
ncbi:NAD-dependent epimerase [Asanoa ferruginea]|uniref:NAD-dependent epimerase/dehydratase family protein n=1 Tax=Asanoa ferruginea TaxID=53367 RepID=UPI0019433DFF|nr:NAD(P)-dependent oxidoreductase [Asanoa ferruginea]GIF52149.1 NAD-dependent epimerase [Asanoa ferruginea]